MNIEPWMLILNFALSGKQWAIKWMCEHPYFDDMVVGSFRRWLLMRIGQELDQHNREIHALIRVRDKILSDNF